jgi:membrane protein implicated in regulation of membrane protease activity
MRVLIPIFLFLALFLPVSFCVFFLIKLALGARREKQAVALPDIVGQVARAQTSIASSGTVFVGGHLWPATSNDATNPGGLVRVVGIEGVVLQVTSIRGHEQIGES